MSCVLETYPNHSAVFLAVISELTLLLELVQQMLYWVCFITWRPE